MILKPIKKGLKILSNPNQEFNDLNNRTLESVVWDYLILLVFVAILAGLFNFIYSLARTLYLDVFLIVDIQYFRWFNYSLGRSTSIIFLYIFSGTFLLFFLSLIIKVFFHKIEYIPLLKILFYSLTPILLLGWLLPNPFPLALWSIFLLVVGIKTYKFTEINRDSIHKRY